MCDKRIKSSTDETSHKHTLINLAPLLAAKAIAPNVKGKETEGGMQVD